MRITLFTLILLTITALAVPAAAASRGSLLTVWEIGLLKEKDSLLSDEAIAELEAAMTETDIPPVAPAGQPLFILGARFGLLYPGASPETGTFVTGPLIGGYLHFDLGPGTLEAALDLASIKAPSDTDREYQLLLIGGVNYIYTLDRFFIGGGLSLANATPMNNLLFTQAVVGMSVFGRAELALTCYFPIASPNNRFMLGASLGCRF